LVTLALNPAVNWLQRRHRLVKRPLAIVLIYLGLVVALIFMVGILVPLLVAQIKGLIDFVVAVAGAPEGPTEHLEGLAQQHGLGWLFGRSSEHLGNLRNWLG
jgi:predicted PurR-regulated permease PerM